MFKRFLHLTLLLSSTFLVQKAQAGEIRNPSNCHDVGFVVKSYDNGISPGDNLCSGGKISVGKKLKIQVLCKYVSSLQWIKEGTYDINNLCSSAYVTPPICDSGKTCDRTFYSPFPLKKPYSSVSSTEFPTWEWHKVVGADRYQISIVSADKSYRFKADTREQAFSLREKAAPLKQGDFYQVRLWAKNSRGSVLAQGTYTIIILSDADRTKLKKMMTMINGLSLSNVEKIQYLDSIYLSYGLMEETIAMLESNGMTNQSTTLLNLLGTRYLQVGLKDKAEKVFALASAVSKPTSKKQKIRPIIGITVLEMPKQKELSISE